MSDIPTRSPARSQRGFRYAAARVAATLAMGSWVVIGVVPVIVVISAFV